MTTREHETRQPVTSPNFVAPYPDVEVWSDESTEVRWPIHLKDGRAFIEVMQSLIASMPELAGTHTEVALIGEDIDANFATVEEYLENTGSSQVCYGLPVRFNCGNEPQTGFSVTLFAEADGRTFVDAVCGLNDEAFVLPTIEATRLEPLLKA